MRKLCLDAEITHGGVYRECFTYEELRELRKLIIENKQNYKIGEKYFSANDDYFTIHKTRDGKISGGYDMDSQLVLNKIDELLEEQVSGTKIEVQ